MKCIGYRVLFIITVLCLSIVSNADGEKLDYDMLLTYGVQPSITMSIDTWENDIRLLTTRSEIENILGIPFYSFVYTLNDTISCDVYVAEIDGLKTELTFCLNNDELYLIVLSPIPIEGGATNENYRQNSINMYHLYCDLFTNCFGEPVFSGEIWYDETYRDTQQKYDYAFEHGDYVYEAVMWSNDEFSISSIVVNESALVGFYVSPVTNID